MRWIAVALCLAVAAPSGAQNAPQGAPPASDLSEGFDLLGEGARLLFRGLMAEMEPALQEMGAQLKAMEPTLRSLAEMIGDIRTYEVPEKLPNGDILIRRKADPLSPAPNPAPEGDIEL